MYHASNRRTRQRPFGLCLLLAGTVAGVMLWASWDKGSAEAKPAGICLNTLTPTPAEIPLSALLPYVVTSATAAPVATATPTPTNQPTSTARPGLPPAKAQAPPVGLIAFLPLFIILVAAIIVLVGAVRILNVLKRPISKFPPRRPAAPPSPAPGPPEVKEPEAAPPPLVTTERPKPGIPYLESLDRTKGVVYCPLSQPVITIGRDSDNDMVIDEHFVGWPTVSRHHAKVERDGELLVLVDLDSENGVYVNDRRTRENILHDGSVVSFGRVRFAFRLNSGGSTP